MFPRLSNLDPNVPLTALYGAESWIKAISEEEFKIIRKNNGYSYMRLVPEAGHHVYANPEVFNSEVLKACNHNSDKN